MEVSRRTALLLAGGGLFGLAVARATRSRARPTAVTTRVPPQQIPPTPAGGTWRDSDAPRRIRQIARPIEDLAGWPGLGDFLAAVAWIESRGNARAGPSADDNRARGWFGHRPRSARLDDLGLSVSALKDEPTAVALAAWYAERCRKFAFPGQEIDWLAIRRCWGLPSDVPKVEHPGYRNQFAKGLASAGLPASFMLEPAFPAGYAWPGVDAVLSAVGGIA